MEIMKLDVLAIGAHPDDVELTCGGTILKLVKQGRKVGVLDLTEGELGTRGSREIRAAEAAEASKILGLSVRESLSLPDGGIESTPETRTRVIRLLRRYRPEILFIPFHMDRHPDHEHAHVLARESWFYAGLQKIVTEDGGVQQEPHRPKAYFCFMQWHQFAPSFIIDVSAEAEEAFKAMQAFRSQFFNPESRERETMLSAPGFLQSMKTRLAYYGDRIGVAYGEPFYSPRPVKVDDILTLYP
jgi:bacillithiol biosynthesis deacetylase BshB1